jgi:hypothetical protein
VPRLVADARPLTRIGKWGAGKLHDLVPGNIHKRCVSLGCTMFDASMTMFDASIHPGPPGREFRKNRGAPGSNNTSLQFQQRVREGAFCVAVLDRFSRDTDVSGQRVCVGYV